MHRTMDEENQPFLDAGQSPKSNEQNVGYSKSDEVSLQSSSSRGRSHKSTLLLMFLLIGLAYLSGSFTVWMFYSTGVLEDSTREPYSEYCS